MAVAASVWALIFAVIHLMWAIGWHVGLDAVTATAAFARPWFLAYDVAVAFGCVVVAAAFGLLAVNCHGRLRTAAHVVSVVAAAAVLVRAAAGLVALAWRATTVGAQASGWDAWFVLGAVLFCAAYRTVDVRRELPATRPGDPSR